MPKLARVKNRIPNLDGIRAIAVLAVIAFHLHWSHGAGGYLGVDVFFVLSGFLITTLLIREYDAHGSIGLKAFWLRRARRLLPALIAVFVCTAAFILVLVGNFSDPASTQMLWTLLEIGNWRTALFPGGSGSMVANTWSLGIEDQFYLICPIVILIAMRRTLDRRSLAIAAVGLAIAETIYGVIVWHVGLPGMKPGSTVLYFRQYAGTDFRSVGLLIGTALALYVSATDFRVPRFVRWSLIPASGFVVWQLTSAKTGFMQNGGQLLFAACVALTIWVVALAPSRISLAVLESWPLKSLGLISYGLYLWSYPLFTGWGPRYLHFSGTWEPLEYAITAIAIATVSFFAIERPIQRHLHFRRPVAPIRVPALLVD